MDIGGIGPGGRMMQGESAKQTTKQTLEARLSVLSLSGSPYLVMHKKTGEEKLKRYTSMGKISSLHPSKNEIEKVLQTYYQEKRMNKLLDYVVSDENGEYVIHGVFEKK